MGLFSDNLPQFSSNLFETPTYNNIKNPDINTPKFDWTKFKPDPRTVFPSQSNLPTFSFTPKGDDLQNNDTPIVDETIYQQDTLDYGASAEVANKKIIIKLIAIGLGSTLLIGGIIFLIVKKSK